MKGCAAVNFVFQFRYEWFQVCCGERARCMKTLLVTEDDRLLRYVLKENLEKENFIVIEAANGARATAIAAQHRVDLILLDLRLPDGNGLDFIPGLRRSTNAPIIVVSGERDKEVRIRALTLGADDYVGKPFDIDELLARINANLRRSETTALRPGPRDSAGADGNPATVEFGNWVLDRARYQVFDRNGTSGNLTLHEFQLLDMLAAHAGKVLKRSDLCKALREHGHILTPRAIDIKITRIRKKIGDPAGAPHIIKTVRGAGYVLEP